jgi:DNA repair exonuclease SbcCD nuclease subunit
MLRILHTADIHLGARFSGLGNKGISQRQQLKATFRNVIATAVDERVSIVLVAGDLFDANQQPQPSVDLVVEQFNLLKEHNIPVCLIPGTHDPLDSSSIYRKVDFEGRCANVKIFAEEHISYKEYPDLDLTVYGKPNLSNRSYVSPLKGLKPLTSSKFHVAMAHGSFYIPALARGLCLLREPSGLVFWPAGVDTQPEEKRSCAFGQPPGLRRG